MNINMLMQQAQRMQKDMESNIKKAKEELAQTEVHAEAGGGLVKVTMTCRNVVKRIEINPELLQDDADMIEDLIAAAMNDAARQAEAITEEQMKAANSGAGLTTGLGWFILIKEYVIVFSDRFDQLVQALRILPSVGPKSAQRMALHLIMKNREGAVGLAHALNEATSYIHECSLCHSLTENEVCDICVSHERDDQLTLRG